MTTGLLTVDDVESIVRELPQALQQRVWRIQVTDNVVAQHIDALLLIQASLLHLASVAFAHYRAHCLDTPDPHVEAALAKFDRPWVEDYAELLRTSLRAGPRPAPLDVKGMRLAAATELRTAMAAVARARELGAPRLGRVLQEERGQRTKPPAFNAMLNDIVKYRNNAMAHVDRTGWADFDDFYECTAPIVVGLALELVCHEAAVECLTRHPVGKLVKVDHHSGEIRHLLEAEIRGRRTRIRVSAQEDVRHRWPDRRWGVELHREVLLTEDADGQRIVGPHHDFTGSAPAPLPLLWPQATDRIRAIVDALLTETWAAREEPRTVSRRRLTSVTRIVPDSLEQHLTQMRPVLLDTTADAVRLDPFAGFVAAVAFGHDRCDLALYDITGALVDSTSLTDDYRQTVDAPERTLDLAARELERLRRNARRTIPPERIFGLGVALACSVRRRSDAGQSVDTVRPSTGMRPGWDDATPAQDLGRILHRRAGWTVRSVAANDATLAALSEARWGVGRDATSLLLVEWGAGIGGGLILDGRVHLGANGAAAEFGHHRLGQPAGRMCSCGHSDCLEAAASLSGIGADLAAIGLADENASSAAVLEAIDRNKGQAAGVLDAAARTLGASLASVIAAVDPELIVIGSGLAAVAPELLTPLREALVEYLPPGYPTPRISWSASERGTVTGAMTLALESFARDDLLLALDRGNV